MTVGTADIVLVQGGRTFDVLRGSLTLRRAGVWRAELELVDTGVQPGRVTLRSLDGAVRFEGYTKRAGAFLERGRCVVWGGAGGLSGAIDPCFARGPGLTARLVLRDLLRAAGETLHDDSAQTELDADLPAWVRRRGTAGDELWRLCDRFGWVARVRPDGTWFVGSETWLEVPSFEHDVLHDDPGEYAYELRVDGFVADLLPGRYFGGRKVASVGYQWGDRALSAFVLGWRGPGSGDAAENHRTAVQSTVALGPDGLAWPAYVDAQHGDGTLDVTPQHDLAPEARTLPALVGVPIRGLAPGVTVTVPVGSIVHVGFEQGRADRPYASAFDTGTLNLSGLKLGANATKGVARGDDATLNGSLTFAVAGAAITITYTPPGGAPQVTVITLVGATAVLTSGGTASLSGKIDNATVSTKTLAE